MNGFKRDLTREDLWEIESDESSQYLTNKLELIWNQASKRYLHYLKKKIHSI